MMELEDLGLDTITSIYCARGENFSQKIFKEALKELGLSAAFTHKMYKNMDKWRIAATGKVNVLKSKGLHLQYRCTCI
jgi:hypothetical protein